MRPSVAYIIGSPRSGTTWLQRALALHPAVVSPQETSLFESYLSTWQWQWNEQIPVDEEQWRRVRFKGLPAVLTSEEFDDLLRSVVDFVYTKVLALKPGATVILDKDPGNAAHWELIRRLEPDAAFIHLLRDGRDVAASLVRASSGWGAQWAPASITTAAWMWSSHVTAARDCVEHTQGIELRFEDVLRSPHEVLVTCLEALGLDAARPVVDELVKGSSLELLQSDSSSVGGGISWGGEVARRRGQDVAEPPGFYGDGTTGAWQAWSAGEREEFESVAGGLLVTLGYAKDDSWLNDTDGDRPSSVGRGILPSRAGDETASTVDTGALEDARQLIARQPGDLRRVSLALADQLLQTRALQAETSLELEATRAAQRQARLELAEADERTRQLEEHVERLETAADTSRRRLEMLESSRTFRYTVLLRTLYAALRQKTGRS